MDASPKVRPRPQSSTLPSTTRSATSNDRFASADLKGFYATGIRGDWAKMWGKGGWVNGRTITASAAREITISVMAVSPRPTKRGHAQVRPICACEDRTVATVEDAFRR